MILDRSKIKHLTLALLFSFVVVAFLGTVSCSSMNGGGPARDLSLEEQYYIGKATAGAVFKKYPYLNNKEANEYLRLIGATISSLTNLSDDIYTNYSFALLDTNELVAFSSPKGFIMISKGLMKSCDNEDEFASIIALMVGMNMTNYPIEALPPKYVNKMDSAIDKDDESKLEEAFGEVVEYTCGVLHSNYPPEEIIYADGEAVRMISEVGYSINSYKTLLEKLTDKKVNDRFKLSVEGRSEALSKIMGKYGPSRSVEGDRVQRFLKIRSTLK